MFSTAIVAGGVNHSGVTSIGPWAPSGNIDEQPLRRGATDSGELRHRLRRRAAADRRGRLAGAPLRRDAARCRRARPPAAARGDRLRRGRQPAQARHHPPRQRRAPPDDRRPERRRGRNQYRARRRSAARDAPAARSGAPETMPRAMPIGDPTPWPLQPEPAPAPGPHRRAPTRRRTISGTRPRHPRSPRPPVPEVRPVRPADTLAGLAEELARPNERRYRTPRHTAATPPIPQARAPTAPDCRRRPHNRRPAADQSLAEMAQRLEAALRRPMAQKVVAETARVTATRRRSGPPRRLPCSRAAPHPDYRRAISNKKWQVF